MTGKSAFKRNCDAEGTARQKDEIDQLFEVLESSDANEILEAVNAGLGNYDDDLLWSQTESYRKGIVAQTLVADVLIKRTIDEAKKWLAENGTQFYKETDMDPKHFRPFEDAVEKGDVDIEADESTWSAKRRYADEIWRSFDVADQAVTPEQRAAMVKATGMEPGEWIPLFWDMFAGKHDMSRSNGAELLKLYLGDHYTFQGDEEDAEQTKRGILRRRS